MQIDQRHVTTVNLHDGRSRDFMLQPDGRGYKLSLVSRDDLVHILLSPHDLAKLRQELGSGEVREGNESKEVAEFRREHRSHIEIRETTKAKRPIIEIREGVKEYRPGGECAEAVTAGPYIFQWSTMDWLSFN